MKILKNEFSVKLESNYGMGNCREYRYNTLDQATNKYNYLISKIRNNSIDYKNCVLKLMHNNKMLDFNKYELKGE